MKPSYVIHSITVAEKELSLVSMIMLWYCSMGSVYTESMFWVYKFDIVNRFHDTFFLYIQNHQKVREFTKLPKDKKLL